MITLIYYFQPYADAMFKFEYPWVYVEDDTTRPEQRFKDNSLYTIPGYTYSKWLLEGPVYDITANLASENRLFEVNFNDLFVRPSLTSYGTYDGRIGNTQYGIRNASYLKITIILYPIATANTYVLTYNPDGGTMYDGIPSVTGTDNKSVNIVYNEYYTTANITKTGYTFDGWKDSFNNVISANMSTRWSYAQNVTLTAIWSATPLVPTYKVVYNRNLVSNYGSSVTSFTETYSYPNNVVISNNIFNTNLQFKYWTDDPNPEQGNKKDPGEVITGWTTSTILNLYAKWSRIIYYDVNGAKQGYSYTSGNFELGTVVTTFRSTDGILRPGYTIATGSGWSTNRYAITSISSLYITTSIDENPNYTIGLYVVWLPNLYTFIYNANGGIGTEPTISIPYDDSISAVIYPLSYGTNFSRIGYVLGGWSTTNNSPVVYILGYRFTHPSTSTTTTLYAVWYAKYVFNYNSNGGNGIEDDTSGLYIDSSSTIYISSGNKFSRTGYFLSGWAKSPTGPSIYTPNTFISHPGTVLTTTLYAVWSLNVFTFKYDANDGSGNIDDTSVSYVVGSTIFIPVSNGIGFSRTGYDLIGWATTRNGGITFNLGSSFPYPGTNTTIILFAVWLGKLYTIQYNNNGGNGSIINTSARYFNSNTIVPISNGFGFSKSGYSLLGWATISTGTVAFYPNSQLYYHPSTQDTVTLYAVWQLNKDYSLNNTDIYVKNALKKNYWTSNIYENYTYFSNVYVYPNEIKIYDNRTLSYSVLVNDLYTSNKIFQIEKLFYNKIEKLRVESGGVRIYGNLNATGLVSSTSDVRLKQIVSHIDSPLEKIMYLNTFKFVPNEFAKKNNIMQDRIYLGINAQEVQQYFPELVQLAEFDTSNLNDGKHVSVSGNNYLAVEYERMVPILIECIKELKTKIDILK
jgi:uncharacterized repeat protein (TIGR02543 family)